MAILSEPYDFWNNKYWVQILKKVYSWGDVPYWHTQFNQEWGSSEFSCIWFYKGEKVYEEGFCYELGEYSHDFTTGVLRVKEGVNFDETMYDCIIERINGSLRLIAQPDY